MNLGLCSCCGLQTPLVVTNQSDTGLAATPFLTNFTIFNLTELPPRLVVLGAGAIGLELSASELRKPLSMYVVAMATVLVCNRRALDRVTKQEHRPIGKYCPKNVRKLCFLALWTLLGRFSDIFRHFSDILSTFPFSGLSNDLPVTSLGWKS